MACECRAGARTSWKAIIATPESNFVRLVAGVCFSDSATRATKIHSLGALGC
jgi:hypothetical protein